MSNHHKLNGEYEGNQKTLRSYVIGFILSALLTLAAFFLIEKRLFTNTYLYISLATLAITQLLVQCICFLRLNNSNEGRWNLLPFLFVILIITILVGGSLWIMYNLNYYMMSDMSAG